MFKLFPIMFELSFLEQTFIVSSVNSCHSVCVDFCMSLLGRYLVRRPQFVSLRCHQMDSLDKCFKFLVQGSLMKQLINTLSGLVDMAGESSGYQEPCNIQRNVLQEAILCSYELLITTLTLLSVSQ